MAKQTYNTGHKIYDFILNVLYSLYKDDLSVVTMASGRTTASLNGVGPILSSLPTVHKGGACFFKAPVMRAFVSLGLYDTKDFVTGPKGNYALKPTASKDGIVKVLGAVLDNKQVSPKPNIKNLVSDWTGTQTTDKPKDKPKDKAIPKTKDKDKAVAPSPSVPATLTDVAAPVPVIPNK